MDIPYNDHEPDNNEVSGMLVSRRRLLTIGGLGVGAVVGGASWAGAATSPAGGSGVTVSPATVANACQLTTEQIEGPYYLDYELIRRDVTEDRVGVPLVLSLHVVDSTTCRALRGAAVEIWHCDALGVYSGYTSIGSGGPGMPGPSPTATPSAAPTAPPTGGPGGPGRHVEPTDDLTYLRGMQITNRLGRASFRTVVPGWYTGRALHIHTKVHVGGRATAAGYEGGHTCHTGQFYFDERAAVAVAGLDPYRGNTATRVTLDNDLLYPDTGAPGGLLTLRYHPRAVARGMVGSIVMAVDPAVDPT